MNDKENLENLSPRNYSFDLYSTLKDVFRRWRSIFFVGVLVSMACFVFATETYTPQYTTSITLLVQNKTNSENPSASLNAANGMASLLKTVLDSSQFKNTVANAMGESVFPGTLSCSIVEETNIINIYVTSDSPIKAYRVLQTVFDVYPTFTNALSANIVLQTLEPPMVPIYPINASTSIGMMIIGFGAGSILMIALYVVLSYFKDTIKKESDIEKKLNIKRIASVPRQKKKLTLKEKMKGVKKSLSLTNPVIGFGFKESFKKIRRLLVSEKKHHGSKIFIVTSSLENEGKTTVAVNMAISLAKLDCKVLLLDADLRKPAVVKFLEKSLEDGQNLTDFLSGEARLSDVTHYDELLNLYIMGCRKGTGKANELTTSEEMKYLLSTVRENYDYVIVDTAPLGFTSDAEDIMTEGDATILVVRRDIATAILINDTIEIISNTGTKILGCVYNDAETTTLVGGKHAYNGYGYGYGYGYGGYGYGGYGKYSQHSKHSNHKEKGGGADGE